MPDDLADPWDFDHLDALEVRPAAEGRVFLGPQHGGPRPALLLVHGGYHGAWCWAPFLRLLDAAGVAAAAVDLRGHGGLAQGPDYVRQGIWEAAEDVAAAAAALARPAVLAGHSLGALVAAAAARAVAPAGLVLLTPSPPGNLEGARAVEGFPEDRPVSPPAGEAARARFLAGWRGEGLAAFAARLCPESPRLLNDRYRLRIAVDPGWVRGPALCLSAGLDAPALHPPGQDEAVARFFGGEYRHLPEASHCLMLDEGREQVAGLIVDWLGRHFR